jgi:D-glycero-D-manno-heptose 1,7-bisphosphate phosphatase
MNCRRAVFVDRDGVVNALVEDPESGRPEAPLDVVDVALLSGVSAALRQLSDFGLLLIGISNQPAAAKGKLAVEDVLAIQDRVLVLLAREGVQFDAFKLCLHHPRGTHPELGIPCGCRKPAPGMLLDAADELNIDLSRSWMIGDTDADIQAGQAAGCSTVLVTEPGSAHKRTGAVRADAVVASLAAAGQLIAQEPVDLGSCSRA